MSDDKFEIHKLHKFEDWLEQECTEYAVERILEHFGVDAVEELTKDQIMQVVDYSEEIDNSWVSLGLRNAVNTWESENDEYVL